ncbi:MAG: hypothetical protein S0880_01655 [Actinomycetota bacterium]|nr:hypothetical protein [Actinomycetota bacterium]
MKRTALSLCVALALTACGDDDTTAAEPSTEATDAPAVTTDPEPEGVDSDDVADGSGDSASGDGATASPVPLPSDPWDPATITDVGFTPELECPLLTYEEANQFRHSNFQPIEVTDSSCLLDNNALIDGSIFVAVGDPGTFDPADPSLVDQLDVDITVEPVDGPGTDAVIMSWTPTDEPQYYGTVFELDGTQVLVTADRMNFDPDQIRTLADAVAANVRDATFTPGTATAQTTGGGFCSLYDGAEIAGGLDVPAPVEAAWFRGDVAGCEWRDGFQAIVEVSEPLGGSVDPNTADAELVVDGLGVPAATDLYVPEIINLDLGGVHVVVQADTFDHSRIIAENLIARAGL